MSLRHPILWLAVLCLALPSALRAQTLPFGISLPPSLNFATSPSPVGSGARAQGKALAFIGIADDATAASHNPGGLVQLERPEVSIVGSYFLRVERQDVSRPDTVVEHQSLDAWNLNYLSATYPFQLWQSNVVVSFNFQRLFDLQGATDVAARFATIDGMQRISSRQTGGLFTLSPAVAVQLTPTFSVGPPSTSGPTSGAMAGSNRSASRATGGWPVAIASCRLSPPGRFTNAMRSRA